ncbi:MAG: S-methyl-5'-thioinosine phosphorylase [Gammaproteobacteria bacterium]|nr:S-methyl-5'-thioinosine phosphorylase [Gammaproteobacteria bacterium]
MAELAIIGGTGLTSLNNLEITQRELVHTPFGEPSGPITYGKLGSTEVMFIPRHGSGHTIPPHKINYRANIWALKEHGAKNVIAVNAVGGIDDDMGPGALIIPDQIIDYSYGRPMTFFEDSLDTVVHIDFTHPYCESLRQLLLRAAEIADLKLVDHGTYGATQGPRLETAAEIRRMERDGCDLVGMTGMPEAALAKEQALCYASICLSVNWAAGKEEGEITMQAIEACMVEGMEKVRGLLEKVPEADTAR